MEISEKCRNFAVVIEIERHIEILLLSNDCVIVPDLGGFMAHHMDARYDEEDGLFLPPLRTLGFNPQLKLNDSLLAQSYVECYDISYPEALRRIEDEVAELKQQLENEGCYELNDIGVLKLNADGRLEFEPCEAGILTPSLYGLSSFEMPLLHNEQKSRKRKNTAVLPLETSVPNAILGQEMAESNDVEEEVETEKAIIIKMSWVRNVVAVAAAIIAFFIIAIPVSNSELQSNLMVSKTSLSMLPTDTNLKVAKIDKEAVKTAMSEVKAKKQVEVKEQPEAVKTDTVSAKIQDEYIIVLASQVTRKNANEYINRLQKAGISDARLYIHNNIVRVICGSYPTQGAAYAGLGKVSKNNIVENPWVMKLKN